MIFKFSTALVVLFFIVQLTHTFPARLVYQNEPAKEIPQANSSNHDFRKDVAQKGTNDSWINDMLTSPKARLFRMVRRIGEESTGDFEDYNAERTFYRGIGCQKLDNLEKEVNSLETYGKCVRVFADKFCSRWSLAVYPGSGFREHVLNNPELNTIESIGPCLSDEFELAKLTTKEGGRKAVVKDAEIPYYVPDLIDFADYEKYKKGVELSSSEFPITHYTLGPKNRVEYLMGVVLPTHLSISQPRVSMEDSPYFQSLEKEDDDVVGYGILPDLGGPANVTYNVFPQSLAGRKRWLKVSSKMRRNLEKTEFSMAVITLNFYYENEDTSRPYAFYYTIGYGMIGNDLPDEIFYGRVRNYNLRLK